MMGCGSSKRTAVMPVGESGDEDGTGGGLARRTSEVPAIEGDDPPVEQLEEESVNSFKSGPIAQPLAFEVPVTEESLIRKHPPKRFQRLEDQQIILSHELLDERQEEAKQRRFQVLSQRVQSAKRSTRRPMNGDENNLDDFIETMNRENSAVEL